jgi:rubrerythrin
MYEQVPNAKITGKQMVKLPNEDLAHEYQAIIVWVIRQAEPMGELALSEVLIKIIAQEQDHLTDLPDALGIDNPTIEEPWNLSY